MRAVCTIERVAITYEDTGAGEPLLLVHGHPFNRTMWRPQVEHFAPAGWRVITPDLRGSGDSAVVPGTTLLGRFAQDLAGLLDHLGIQCAILGGLSMGGQITMEFYRRYPARVRGLVLADASPEAETPQGRSARYAAADRLLREGMEPYADEVLGKMVAPSTIATRPDVTAHVLDMMRRTSPEGAAALRGRAERVEYGETLAGVQVPVLIVVGRQDAFTPVAGARRMHARIPGSTLTVIEGAGHMPNLEQPETFTAALGRSLGAVTRSQVLQA